MKVYCKNCRYFKRSLILLIEEHCEAPKNIELSRDYYSPFKEGKLLPETINSNNKCKFYKRKWWKFWVKEYKRKILKGAQPKTDAGLKPDTKLVSYIGNTKTKKEVI